MTTAAVPAAAELVIGLVNTRAHAYSGDALDSAEEAAAVAAALGGGPDEVPLLRRLRADLVAVLGATSDEEQARAWAGFTADTADVTVRHAFTPAGALRLEGAAGGPAATAVLLAVAELVRDGSWSRVKTCAFEPCGSAFYDTTRSRTQKWHSYEVCGNRANVAAHRARARTAP